MTNPICDICGNKSDFLLNKEAYALYLCPKCRMVFVCPQPAASFLKEDVYSFESGYQANKEKDLSRIAEDSKTARILSSFEEYGAKGKLLDVGCSNGEFMYLAKKKGFEPYGVELNRRTADIGVSNGLRVFNGLLEEAGYAPQFFDSIYLGDIIEHVPSPQAFIDQCKKVLKTGGLITISTPNLDCLWAKTTFLFYSWFGIPWSSVTPPHHLFQFSYNNLTELMEKKGFKSVSVWYAKPPRLMYELGSLHLLKQWKKNRKIRGFVYLLFAYALYTLAYGIVRLVNIFLEKDFAMVATYKND